jgi:hypothetical protein
MPSSFHGLAEDKVNPNTENYVREAARLQSIGDGQGFVKCSCKTGCGRKTCKCVRSNVLCTVIQGAIIKDEVLLTLDCTIVPPYRFIAKYLFKKF